MRLIDKFKRSREEAREALKSTSMTSEQRERLTQIASLTDRDLQEMARKVRNK